MGDGAIGALMIILLILAPINGLIWLGMRRERERMRRILIGFWILRNKRNK